jgi:isopenicillin N synthase-like dioxygenase
VRDGNSILRLLHYPPVPPETAGAIRAGAHEDINVITLLLGAEEAGLQLLGKDGEWRFIDAPPGSLVCNVGDMLQRLTGHRLPSTTHRVVNPAPERMGVARYSTPFFLHFRPDYLIEALPGGPVAEPPITANDYLLERLARHQAAVPSNNCNIHRAGAFSMMIRTMMLAAALAAVPASAAPVLDTPVKDSWWQGGRDALASR